MREQEKEWKMGKREYRIVSRCKKRMNDKKKCILKDLIKENIKLNGIIPGGSKWQ